MSRTGYMLSLYLNVGVRENMYIFYMYLYIGICIPAGERMIPMAIIKLACAISTSDCLQPMLMRAQLIESF